MKNRSAKAILITVLLTASAVLMLSACGASGKGSSASAAVTSAAASSASASASSATDSAAASVSSAAASSAAVSASSATTSGDASSDEMADASGETVTLTDNEGMDIAIKGNLMTVSLDGNATTGYTWSYTISDPTVLTCESDDYAENSHEEGMVGVPGVQHYTFKAMSEGSATVVFTYARDWESGETGDAKTIEADVDDSGNISATMGSHD